MSEIKSYNPQRFHHFLAHLTRLMDQSPNEAQALAGASQLLGDLVSSDDWLLPDFAQPHPLHYQQYLLFADPQDRFSVVSFVWGPGQATPIHDHTVWGLIGMLRGSEMCQSYSRMSDGRWAPAGLQIQMIPGDVEAVSPRLGDVHRVWNAYSDQVSISIHLYGANIGKVQRSVYYEDGSRKTFISGYSNVPELFSGLVEESSFSPQVANPVGNQGATVQGVGVVGKTVTSAPQTALNKPFKPNAPASVASNGAQKNTQTNAPLNANPRPTLAKDTSPAHSILAHPNSSSVQPAQVPGDVAIKSQKSVQDVSELELSKQTSQVLELTQPHETVAPLADTFNLRQSVQVELPLSEPEEFLIPQELHQSTEQAPLTNTLQSEIVQTVSGDSVQNTLKDSPVADTELNSEPESEPEPEPVAKIGGFEVVKSAQVRNYFLNKTEVAFIDAREEDPYAQSHPLFACNMPLGRIEVDAYRRIPRRDTIIVIYDNLEGVALKAANTLKRMGYTNVSLLEGGLSGWAAAGFELFRDVNVPSKAFGEWVESIKHTPSLSASEVKALLEQKADVVVLDARRFDEYQTMSIPGAISVPGAELALRVRTIAPKATTRVIVNCAGRTRSIIGAQSLVNAGIPNPVCALRNGTIGWMLAGQELAKGAQARFPDTDPADLAKAQATSLALAFRSGLKRIDLSEYLAFEKQLDRTTYLFDIRTPEEFEVSHLRGAISAPGGQLVQETDHSVPVRGARIVLYDTEGVRAYMTGSWLVQLGWEVHVIKNISLSDLTPASELIETAELPPALGSVEEATPEQVKEWIANRTNLTLVIDVGDSAQYVKRHIPGAWWLLRSQMQQDFTRVHKANRYVLTCADGKASRYAVEELKQLVRPGVQVMWLKGGNASWIAQGFSTQQGESYVVSPRIDRYRRPYEGTQNPEQAMQAYLDWEYGLVDQLKRDGTHGFKVI